LDDDDITPSREALEKFELFQFHASVSSYQEGELKQKEESPIVSESPVQRIRLGSTETHQTTLLLAPGLACTGLPVNII
jgi:hypothetical protein